MSQVAKWELKSGLANCGRLWKRVGASKRLGHIIDGEAMINDGTAIVVFTLLNGIAKGHDKSPGQVAAFFLWVGCCRLTPA